MPERFSRRALFVAMVVVELCGLVLIGEGAHSASAQSGGGYDLTWSTIDGGGMMLLTGGDYSLGGTIGQPDAGVMNNGGYSLTGGFWGGAAVQYNIYLPVVLKG
jgi:hypothetical protein